MVVERSTKQQVQAFRYGARRVEHALATGSARAGTPGPRPGISLLVGAVIAGLITAGFAVFGLLRPAPSIGKATVLVDTEGGGAYVVRDGVAHPALNLASALLAAGDTPKADGTGEQAAPATPTIARVTTSTLATLPKGQLIGIPGAPSQVPASDQLARNRWQVCDVLAADPAAAAGTRPTRTTTVLIGAATPAPPDPATAFLVTADDGSSHLVMAGSRSRVDLADTALVQGLGIDPAAARPISTAALNAIPEGQPMGRPDIPAQGRSVTLGDERFTVGEVVRVERATGGYGFYVALNDGVQSIGPVVADVLRAVTGQGEQVRTVAPSAVASAPEASTPLELAAFPAIRPEVLASQSAPGMCVDWHIEGQRSRWSVVPVAQLPLPTGAVPVPVPPGRDAAARAKAGVADQVYVPPGSGLAIGQGSGTSAQTGNLFLVTDQGIAYPVVSAAAMKALGHTSLTPAPAELVSLLPTGPTLDPTLARQYFSDAPAGAGN